jgi:tetratricopeptide (TPR) repeat protein
MTLRQSAFAVTVLVLGALIQTPAFAAPRGAAGRKHAAKANQLAAHNRCKAAVAEFTKAYRLLKDPALLFNRAECYRKIGKDSQAVKDYEQFLAEMPGTPNRSTVEARIASLRGGAQTAEPSRKQTHAQSRARQAPPGDTHAEKWGASDATPAGEKGHAPGAQSVAIGPAAPAVPEPRAAANLTSPPTAPEPKQASRGHAWIWIGTAVVVVGAGAFAAYRYWPRPKTDVPQTPLGNYAF